MSWQYNPSAPVLRAGGSEFVSAELRGYTLKTEQRRHENPAFEMENNTNDNYVKVSPLPLY